MKYTTLQTQAMHANPEKISGFQPFNSFKNSKWLLAFLLFFASFHFAKAQLWQNVYPGTTPDHITKITAVDSTNAWALSNSSIIKSNDKGATWKTVFLNDNLTLKSAYFLSNTHAWVTAKAKSFSEKPLWIGKTTDGGKTWKGQTRYSPVFTIENIYFQDTQKGFLLNEDSLFRTTNGGESWNFIQKNLRGSIIFPSKQIGFIVSDQVHKTTNGGSSWFKITSFGYADPYSIDFSDSLNGVLLNKNDSNKSFKTTDGGNTWNSINNRGLSVCVLPNGIDYAFLNSQWPTGSALTVTIQNNLVPILTNLITLNTIDFFDLKNGMVAGNGGAIFTTSDTGKTWVKRFIRENASFNYKSIHFSDSLNGAIIGLGRRLHTTDAGNSWNFSTSTDPYNSEKIISLSKDSLYSIGSFRVNRSTNGGKNWTEFYYPQDDLISLKNFKKSIWVGGRTNIHRFVNGIWTKCFPVNPNNQVYYREIWPLSDDTIFCATGYDVGNIIKSTNGGTTWANVINTGNITSLYFLNKKVGWYIRATSATLERELFKTTDGGLTWQKISNYSGLLNPHFIDEWTGYAFTSERYPSLVKTLDGGLTWRKSNYGENFLIEGFFFSKTQNWIVGTNKYDMDIFNISSDNDYYGVISQLNPKPFAVSIQRPVLNSDTAYLCFGDSIKLSGSLSAGYYWFYNGKPIASSLANGKEFWAKNPGTYTLRACDENLNDGWSNSIFIKSTSPSAPNILSVSKTVLCGNQDSVLLTSSSASGNKWFRNGNLISGATEETYLAKQAGSYTVRFFPPSGCGSFPSAPVQITQETKPNAPVLTSNNSLNTFCIGDSLKLTSSALFRNRWFRNGLLIQDTGQFIYIKDTSIYSVKTRNSGKVCFSNASLPFKTTLFDSSQTLVISAPSGKVICGNRTVILYSSRKGFNQWFLHGNTVGSGLDSLLVSDSGSFQIRRGFGSCLSKASDILIVTKKPLPAPPVLTASKDTFCLQDTVWISTQYNEPVRWFLNQSPNPILVANKLPVTQSGNVHATYTDVNGCISEKSEAKMLYGFDCPHIFQEPVNAVFNPGQGASFSLFSSGTDVKYRWEKILNNQFFSLIDGNGISGSKTATLILSEAQATIPGQAFRCIVSISAGFADTSSIVYVLGYGPTKSESVIGSDFLLFPNPAHNKLLISSSKKELSTFNFEIITSNGSLVLKGESGFDKEIDITRLPQGMYAFKTNLSGKTRIFKFVKEKN